MNGAEFHSFHSSILEGENKRALILSCWLILCLQKKEQERALTREEASLLGVHVNGMQRMLYKCNKRSMCVCVSKWSAPCGAFFNKFLFCIKTNIWETFGLHKSKSKGRWFSFALKGRQFGNDQRMAITNNLNIQNLKTSEAHNLSKTRCSILIFSF
jgi:hypothetical protein